MVQGKPFIFEDQILKWLNPQRVPDHKHYIIIIVALYIIYLEFYIEDINVNRNFYNSYFFEKVNNYSILVDSLGFT